MDKTLTDLLAGIAAISLLVGGIGVMNIMLVSVTERIREIGLRKALGAKGRAIRRQFLVEASVLGLAGGVLGSGLGLVGATVLPHLINDPITISPTAIVGTAAAVSGSSMEVQNPTTGQVTVTFTAATAITDTVVSTSKGVIMGTPDLTEFLALAERHRITHTFLPPT